MKVYCELAGEHGCIGVIPDPETELILTGTVVHTEPEAYRDLPLARVLAEECDLYFFFGASTEPPFYTVPKTEVFARDSRGGYFLTTGDTALDWSAPICYIDAAFRCHRLVPVGGSLAEMGRNWRETMVSCNEIEFFPDRAAAMERYDIRTFQQLMEEHT